MLGATSCSLGPVDRPCHRLPYEGFFLDR
jgi:hypothetical protein